MSGGVAPTEAEPLSWTTLNSGEPLTRRFILTAYQQQSRQCALASCLPGFVWASVSAWVDLCPALAAVTAQANLKKRKERKKNLLWSTWGPQSNRKKGGGHFNDGPRSANWVPGSPDLGPTLPKTRGIFCSYSRQTVSLAVSLSVPVLYMVASILWLILNLVTASSMELWLYLSC